jgi:hypothetical protein
MKKSDVINQIAYTISSMKHEEDLYLARVILATIEDMGMLPPKTKLNTLNIEDNAWEPEDG